MVTTQPKTTARQRMIESAQKLMLARGYAATTVDEICEDAGVSKGSFYHAFASKEALGLEALNQYYETGIARLMSGPFTEETDPIRRLIGFLKRTEERSMEFWGHGCLLGTFAIDMAETSPVIRDRVAEQFDEITDRFALLFEPLAAPDGREPTARSLASGYLAALEGSIVMARAFNDPKRIQTGLRAFRVQLEVTMR